MDRRQFLTTALAGAAFAPALLSAPARAIGPKQRTRIVQIRHRGHWDPHPTAAAEFARQVALRTSTDIDPTPEFLELTDPKMRRMPFAILCGDGAFTLNRAEQAALTRWLSLGGFLLIDNQGADAPSAGFQRSVRRALTAAFPQTPLERVSAEHVIFRSFYRLDYPAGRVIRKPHVEGLTIGKRLAVVSMANDLMGALARDPMGTWQYTPKPGGENQREMAIRFAVNLMLYAQCMHYKDDQVHLDYLLRRRKWKIDRPKTP